MLHGCQPSDLQSVVGEGPAFDKMPMLLCLRGRTFPLRTPNPCLWPFNLLALVWGGRGRPGAEQVHHCGSPGCCKNPLLLVPATQRPLASHDSRKPERTETIPIAPQSSLLPSRPPAGGFAAGCRAVRNPPGHSPHFLGQELLLGVSRGLRGM